MTTGFVAEHTHIFTVTDFERAAQAYIAGLERLLATQSTWRILPTAVASFSVGAIDAAVDPVLREMGRPDLCGQTAVALAQLLYQRYRQIFSGPRWERLARANARPLRPKWTRTTPVDPALPRTHYANALIIPETIMTFSPESLAAFEQSGQPVLTLTQDVGDAEVRYIAGQGNIVLARIPLKIASE